MMSLPASRPLALRARQRGLSLFGLLFVGALILMVVVLVMRVLPTVLEYQAARKALQQIVATGETSPALIAQSFDRIAAIEDISSITGRDLKIVRIDNKVTLSFAYQKTVPLVSIASLLLDYRASAASK